MGVGTLFHSHAGNVSDWFGWWLASVVLLVAVGYYCDRSAAMRGSKGLPPPYLMDKFLRGFFFSVMAAPACLYVPTLTIVCLLYLPSYLDGYVSDRDAVFGERAQRWRIPVCVVCWQRLAVFCFPVTTAV